MYATDPDTPRQPSPVRCPECSATHRDCERLRWLSGGTCCAACSGPAEHERGDQ